MPAVPQTRTHTHTRRTRPRPRPRHIHCIIRIIINILIVIITVPLPNHSTPLPTVPRASGRLGAASKALRLVVLVVTQAVVAHLGCACVPLRRAGPAAAAAPGLRHARARLDLARRGPAVVHRAGEGRAREVSGRRAAPHAKDSEQWLSHPRHTAVW